MNFATIKYGLRNNSIDSPGFIAEFKFIVTAAVN